MDMKTIQYLLRVMKEFSSGELDIIFVADLHGLFIYQKVFFTKMCET
jgi:hypothetical protein